MMPEDLNTPRTPKEKKKTMYRYSLVLRDNTIRDGHCLDKGGLALGGVGSLTLGQAARVTVLGSGPTAWLCERTL